MLKYGAIKIGIQLLLMKITALYFLFALIVLLSPFVPAAFAEDKQFSGGPAGIIPKLPKTPDDPELFDNFVRPSWGPVCQRYTYTVTYRDKEGRKPEYMRIIFNGKPIEMEKQNPADENYKSGVRYIYKFVPNKLSSNFYYFEASNGVGKTRAAIIDSPDNGPVLFESSFTNNEIVVIEKSSNKKILSFSAKDEWIGGIAFSDDGKYLAAKTSNHVYLFDTTKPEQPLWTYTHSISEVGGDVKGGIAISASGDRIFALVGSSALLFHNNSNQPVWKKDVGNGYNVAISKDGNIAAAGTSNGSGEQSNSLVIWNTKSDQPLWQYHSSGNFHDVSLANDGSYIGASTGCPDRRAYVFSKESNVPLVRTEMLTRDSPVHRAKISSDGSVLAVGSESDAGAVFLFNNDSPEPLWKFSTIGGSSVRALNMTPDGTSIGASTFGGQAYIFDASSNKPVSSWTVNAALGGLDIADDGSFIAVGGTDNKLHIFEKGNTVGTQIDMPEYVEEIDISANGKYIAAGTGGSVYFFENFNKNQNKVYPCTTIIEPKAQDDTMGPGNPVNQQQTTANPCDTAECTPEELARYQGKNKSPGMIFGIGFMGSFAALCGYLGLTKLKPRKLIVIILSVLSIAFLGFTVYSAVANKSKLSPFLNSKGEETTPEPGKIIMQKNQKPVLNGGEQQTGCGNNICESVIGETKGNCPQDCSAQ